jgi:L,D-peptidoglycan transpeptidase YkuD (ErfK/YbiS/YcfS/YnhG family)
MLHVGNRNSIGFEMDLIVKSANLALWGDKSFPCAVGRNGFVAASEKVEGDGKTPMGRWTMREIFFRPDRAKIEEIVTALPIRPLGKTDGWCDQPGDPKYNKLVSLPYPASAEQLWRDDHLYDFIVVLGYNDDPPVAGKGSAIFFHIARDGFAPTAGCVAMRREDLVSVLRDARPGSAVLVKPGL